MADSDTISGIENLKSAVSGETPAYQYKDPNTDMMKAISKCIDAADGTIDDQYEYKNPNTDVIKKMDELAIAISEGGGGGIDYLESWIINSKTSLPIPTSTTHITYTNGNISAFDVCQNAGNDTITMGDITTFIGNASDFYWWVTANTNMTYRIYDVLTGTLGALQTAQSGDRIISDGDIDIPYCMEIRRYS